VGFIWVFLYAIKVVAASKLIIPVRFGNNTNLKIPKVFYFFSSTNLDLFFLLLNTFLIIFHFRPLALFSNILSRSETLINFANSGSTLFCLW
jgi:hypothetical protein